MNLKILAYFLFYLISSGMFFLLNSEGDFQTDLSKNILVSALQGLSAPVGLAFAYWWQNRKKRKTNVH